MQHFISILKLTDDRQFRKRADDLSCYLSYYLRADLRRHQMHIDYWMNEIFRRDLGEDTVIVQERTLDLFFTKTTLHLDLSNIHKTILQKCLTKVFDICEDIQILEVSSSFLTDDIAKTMVWCIIQMEDFIELRISSSFRDSIELVYVM